MSYGSMLGYDHFGWAPADMSEIDKFMIKHRRERIISYTKLWQSIGEISQYRDRLGIRGFGDTGWLTARGGRWGV